MAEVSRFLTFWLAWYGSHFCSSKRKLSISIHATYLHRIAGQRCVLRNQNKFLKFENKLLKKVFHKEKCKNYKIKWCNASKTQHEKDSVCEVLMYVTSNDTKIIQQACVKSKVGKKFRFFFNTLSKRARLS